MIEVIKFFLKHAKLHVKKAKIFSQIGNIDQYQESVNKANELNTKDIPASSRSPLIIQSLLLFIGFLFIFSAATIVLLK